jgi:hypothetical protein
MVKFSRRHFLQASGAALTTWALHQKLAKYQQTLAQPTSRKLALLVGINEYADSSQNLGGCVNDAILQRQLLIHRFGFNPQDIVMVLDEDATRQGILDAFEEHLIKQAKPGDVVVYHYSGHGSLVRDPDPIFLDRRFNVGVNGTFVPTDANLPVDYPEQGGTVADIMGHTLFLLMSAIQTEYFTAVLDSCFSGAATRKITVRSRDGGEKLEISPQEKAYQEQWLSRLDWSPDEFADRYKQGIANGVVLAATQRSQFAIDEQLNKVITGAFTYRLTQHLWQHNTTPKEAIARVASQMPNNYNQLPLWEAEAGSGYEEDPLFFIENPDSVANARVIQIQDDRATILLAGIYPKSMQPDMELTTLDGQGMVRLIDGNDLIAEGEVSGQVQEGTLLKLA